MFWDSDEFQGAVVAAARAALIAERRRAPSARAAVCQSEPRLA
jgi:hypothetical protein